MNNTKLAMIAKKAVILGIPFETLKAQEIDKEIHSLGTIQCSGCNRRISANKRLCLICSRSEGNKGNLVKTYQPIHLAAINKDREKRGK